MREEGKKKRIHLASNAIKKIKKKHDILYQLNISHGFSYSNRMD